MNRETYLDIAARRPAVPIGAHLVLSEEPDPAAARLDGDALGRVIVETARRFRTSLAFPLMDLQIEREDLLGLLEVSEVEEGDWHLAEPGATTEQLETVRRRIDTAPTPRMKASAEALRCVAQEKELLPIGMCIGPFSLMTRLLEDPITCVYLAAAGGPGSEEGAGMDRTLDLCTETVLRWIRLQAEAGARAVCVCEPACNTVYLSPNQLAAEPGLLDRMVLAAY